MAFYKLCSILLVLCAFAAGQEEIEDFKAVKVYPTMVKISWNETEKLATYIVKDINRNISRTTNETMMTWYDLKPDTRYQFNVVISMINNSLPTLNYTSEEPLNVTTNNATFMSIANLTSMNVTMNSSKLLWQPKQGVKSYTLFHRVEGASEYTMKMTEMNMLDLNDLMPNTTYEVLVVAQANSTDDDDIRGYESMKHMFRTAAMIKIDDGNMAMANTTMKPMSTGSPNKTDELFVKHSAGKKSLEIFWSRYLNASKYIVYYWEKGTDDKRNISVSANSGINSTQEEVELKNLKTNTEYLVTVVVERQVGNSTEIIIQYPKKTFKTGKVIQIRSTGSRDLAASFSLFLALAFTYLFF